MDVIMPQMGETVAEGTLTVWHKKVGDTVSSSDVLFEIGTDKVEMEVPALADGVLTEILVAEGDTVAVGTKLAVIQGEGEAAQPAAPKPEASQPAAISTAPLKERPTRDRSMKLSPVVRKLLAENNLAHTDIVGTGRDGRIKRGDVLAYLKAPNAAPTAPFPAEAPGAVSGEGITVVPFSYRRKMTAEHMVRSKSTSPHVLQAVEVDFSAVNKARAKIGPDWKAREGYSLTYLPFIAKAVCSAIKEFPHINAHIEKDHLVVFDRVNLAMAIDLNFEGLVAPVIRDADLKAVTEIARATNDLAKRARADELTPDEFANATYTITNNGSFGTLITAPIINQPQVAILSTDGITKRPLVVEQDGEDMIAIRPVGILAQSFDHRAIDGSYSGAFMRRVKEIIEGKNWVESVS
ncbi:MAG: dihydrolipoyllysine-residue succinyltransferase [Rhodospirillaceae bacterium]|jgi:pyruvate dehydrogenase E2 component (dihydrolipoamide acetyltransferase)|nr:dihydrolipoyllysine-residue succinyltransferase [Rhodospirillaceae bacterium]MBT5940960.1 dihydrolipoyllysine-residue succinyltransferase [Rhodospirillaceae bacterium]MBT7266860.1 dihydrolipoyllysine-residue succinyltransferase [Rhodospirillaceae bacterium]